MAEEQRDDLPVSSGSGEESRPPERFAKMAKFYLVRFRLYVGLAALVALVWIPTLGVPSLRMRLTTRLERLRAAMAGTSNTLPITSDVGQNPKPFPPEFERPVAERPRLPVIPGRTGIVDLTQQVIRPAPPRPARQAPTPTPEAQPEAAPPEPTATEAAPSDNPEYRKDKEAQQAYDLLLASRSDVKAIIDGANPALRLKDWGAARRDDDTFWVMLMLTTSQGTDSEYIWQVRVASKQVTPLNFNARSLGR